MKHYATDRNILYSIMMWLSVALAVVMLGAIGVGIYYVAASFPEGIGRVERRILLHVVSFSLCAALLFASAMRWRNGFLASASIMFLLAVLTFFVGRHWFVDLAL